MSLQYMAKISPLTGGTLWRINNTESIQDPLEIIKNYITKTNCEYENLVIFNELHSEIIDIDCRTVDMQKIIQQIQIKEQLTVTYISSDKVTEAVMIGVKELDSIKAGKYIWNPYKLRLERTTYEHRATRRRGVV